MSHDVRVSIEEVLELAEKCKDINDMDFEEIIWTLNGKDIEADRNSHRFWCYAGLSNMEFIISGAYNRPQFRVNHFGG